MCRQLVEAKKNAQSVNTARNRFDRFCLYRVVVSEFLRGRAGSNLSSTPFQMRPRVGNTPGGSNPGVFMNAAASRGSLSVGGRRPPDGTGQGGHELYSYGSACFIREFYIHVGAYSLNYNM